MLRKAAAGSCIANAARVVILGTIGRRWNSEYLIGKARWLYQGEIRSFQEAISDSTLASSAESMTTVTLFGLYEVGGLPAYQQAPRHFCSRACKPC